MTHSQSIRPRWRAALHVVCITALIFATAPAGAVAAPEQAERRFEVMTYNLYLGASLQPLFGVSDPLVLIERAAQVFAHVEQVDFNERAVAIARQIVETSPDLVALQEVALWQTAPLSDPSSITTRFDFLRILLRELDRQGSPYEAVVKNQTFSGALPISFTTLGIFTDRNAIIVRSDLPTSELMTANEAQGVYAHGLPVPIGDTVVQVRRGWASVDVLDRGKWYRLIDTHLEAFNTLVRLAQVGELVDMMSSSPYPVVLAGDLNVYPEGIRAEDAPAWEMFGDAGLVDAWVEAGEAQAFTAGQSDDLDNVPSTLDNTVDFVLHGAVGYVDAVEDSGDIVGEELDDRTDTIPPLWPSDHAGVVVTLHIAKP